ncbi:4-alpha-glucanotransferase [Streptobacillus moniliformis]|uniref:4-alpha-glucanotransferase n=2 Tax=Streptobacillus moniliformis TaxID=34105 RepID=UPI0007E37C68|nr:4-alpha-glucanotransferase [Streptobacillus moniliformis]
MRKAGILLHPTSLSGKEGIGTLGFEAYRFIDFLKKSKQKLWQIFPLGPTGYGDSPYQCFSAFAGNPYLIDLETLVQEGYLDYSVLDTNFGDNKENIDYGMIYTNKLPILRSAFEKFNIENEDFIKFNIENDYWLDNYSLFAALKTYFNGESWSNWPNELKNRDNEAIKEYKVKLADEINYQKFLQYIFLKQWKSVKSYANQNGIEIIGDIPIFVSMDSADAWSNPEIFLFDKDRNPVKVAGVPPDYFSATGQLWGNPLFDWNKLKETGYKWWIDRVKANLSLYDIIRIDHFRGFESYWAVNYGETTAINGKWEKGPGIDLFNAIKKSLGEINIIAEDLGILTDEVVELKESAGFPGMKILQFAFDKDPENEYLPHNYEKNTVVYTGTHDNDTTNSWYFKLNDMQKGEVRDYLNVSDDSYIVYSMIRLALRSVAETAIIPMQDYLNLGEFARINTPGLASGNWQWRLNGWELNDDLASTIAHITEIYGR